MARKPKAPMSVETLTHEDATRKNIPTAEHQPVLEKEEQVPKELRYPRNTDIDPQLIWRGKDEQDWSDLVVHAPPLYIQEKVHPKVLIDDLLRTSNERTHDESEITPDLFSDFNGIPMDADKTEFYRHDQNWSNRMILGDSLQVMASMAEREGLHGKVQCIYFDPPYGIKFNSNFQWSTTDRKPRDGKTEHITREPEQVKAFRDTWRDGIHSYLTYLRDRLTVARDLLTDSGSIFIQIGDENVHRVRALMDEVFGEDNFIAIISVKKTGGVGAKYLDTVFDYIVWYGKNSETTKYRSLYENKEIGKGKGTGKRYDQVQLSDYQERALSKEEKKSSDSLKNLDDSGAKFFQLTSLNSDSSSESTTFNIAFEGKDFYRTNWKTNRNGLERLIKASRVRRGDKTVRYKRFLNDFSATSIANNWEDAGVAGKIYVVQTAPKVIQRCILMTTDPGDLVLDPTCGSGTAAYVAEQWGRRWITIDTSRVALALARARIMGARLPFYLLADSRQGQSKEAKVSRTGSSKQPVHENIRHGFVYERVPHITLRSIANNAEIDVIWERMQQVLEPLREKLNTTLSETWKEWEIPREADVAWSKAAKALHEEWWQAIIARQTEVDASIAAKADLEYLYDKPYENKKTIRVAGPFTVESLSPHRVLGVDEDDELIDGLKEDGAEYEAKQSFPQMILENLKTAGVQQAHKEDRIAFTALTVWPGDLVCAEGRYLEGDIEQRAAIFIGPEFGTVQRADLAAAAREAGDAAFDVLIACAFNYEAHATEFSKLGRIPVLKARMNADLHMAEDLKNTGKGNLFVIFGEPDIDLLPQNDGQLRVKVKGVDVFKPQTGEIISDGADGIACWFVDTDYNEESFFVRHAYFLGANDPYKALKTTLKAEIDSEAWATLHSDTSRPFDKPANGRIAVKVINHLGDEVMKVFRV